MTARLVRRLAEPLPKPVVLWIYDPGSAPMAGSCGEEFAVYDCVDDYVEQTTSLRGRASSPPATDRRPRSQLVFATSTTMYERQRARERRDAPRPERRRLRALRWPGTGHVSLGCRRPARPVLGFAGNFLASKVDFDLLERVAASPGGNGHCS